jgi:hypothetical protein
MAAMRKADVIATLRAHEAELRSAGVQLLSVFGSVARGDATDASDVDVVIRLSPEAAGRAHPAASGYPRLPRRHRSRAGSQRAIAVQPRERGRACLLNG